MPGAENSLRLSFFRRKRGTVKEVFPAICETTRVLSEQAKESECPGVEIVSTLKSTIERIKALETERKNLLLEIEELKRMADDKARVLESEINMLRDEVKSLRVLLSGEDLDSEFGQKRKK